MKNKNKLILSLLLSSVICGTAGVIASTDFKSYIAKAETTATEEVVTKNTYLVGADVVLNENITLNYHVRNIPAGYTQATITFSYRGQTYTETKEVGENAELVFNFDKVSPQNMTEKIDATLTLTGEGLTDVVESKNGYSVAEYCNDLLSVDPALLGCESQDQYDALRTLIADLLNYGDMAQLYRNANVDNMATSVLNVAQKNAISELETPSETDMTLTGEDSSATLWKSATLKFDSKIGVVLRFYAKDAQFAGDVSLKVSVGEGSFNSVAITKAETATAGISVYTAEIDGFSVTDFDKVITAQVYDGETAVGKQLTYSIKSYLYSMTTTADVDEKMVNLAKATYSYGLSAKSFIDVMGATEFDDPTQSIKEIKFDNIGELLSTYGPTMDYKFNKVFGIGSFVSSAGQQINTMVSDGEYIYAVASAGNGGAKPNPVHDHTCWYDESRIIKLSIETGKVVGYTAQFLSQGGTGQWSGVAAYVPLYLKDGVLYTYNSEHEVISVATSALNANGVAVAVATDAVEFPNARTTRAINYNAAKKQYAVLQGSTVTIYDEAGTSVNSFAVDASFDGANVYRLASDDNYIVVNYSVDGVITPRLNVYDWNGAHVKKMTIPFGAKDLGRAAAESNAQGIAIANGKLYFSSIHWTTAPTGSSIFSIDGLDTTVRTPIIEATKKYNVELTDTTIKSWGSVGSSYVYNASSDGASLFTIAGTSATSVKVVSRYDDRSGLLVSSASVYASAVGSTWENIPLFCKDGFVYTYGATSEGGAKSWVKLPVNFTASDAWQVADEGEVVFGEIDGSTVGGVYYDTTVEKFAVQTGESKTIQIFDKNGTALTSFAVGASIANVPKYDGTTGTASYCRITGENGYIYVHYFTQGTKCPAINVYDFNGASVGSMILPNENSGNAATTSKMEGVAAVNGEIYFTALRWGSGNGSYVGKVSYSYKPDKPVISLGEYYETATEKGYEMQYDVQAVNGGAALPGMNMYTHGIVTDGTYAYYPSSGGVATSLRIYKTYLGGTTIAGYAKVDIAISAPYTFTGYSFYKDGYIYVAEGGKLYRVATDAFTTTFEDAPVATLVTNAEIAGVEGVSGIRGGTYSKENGAYAFSVANGNVIILNQDGTVRATVENALEKPTQITSDKNYIYALYETENKLTLAIYDWNGNVITNGTAIITSGISPNASSNNIQGFCVMGKDIYIHCCSWAAPQGAFVYKVSLNTSNWTL